MLHRFGVAMGRHRLLTLLTWVVLCAIAVSTALLGVTGQSVFQRLAGSGSSVTGEASHAADLLQGGNGTKTQSLTLLVHGVDLTDRALAGAFADAAGTVQKIEGVESVTDPLALPRLPGGTPNPAAAALFAADGRGVLLNVNMATVDGSLPTAVAGNVTAALQDTANALRADFPGATVEVGGTSLLVKSLSHIAETDLQKGEVVSLPVALVMMLIIFGGFLAAGMPLIGSIASIIGALGALFGFSFLMDIDTTVMNVITVIGLGLSIDYGLLIVSRFREEFRALAADAARQAATAGAAGRGRHAAVPGHVTDAGDGTSGKGTAADATAGPGSAHHRLRGHRHERHELMLYAVGNTVNTAGRTVLFSGLTFAIATAGLFVFQPAMLRAIGIGAICVVLIAILTALTLVPALLGYFGERLIRPGVMTRIPVLGRYLHSFGDVAPAEGFFSKLTRRVQRRPALVAVVGLLVLGAVGSPILTLNISNDNTIPRASTQYTFFQTLRTEFPLASGARVQLVSAGTQAQAQDWATQVRGLEHVTAVSDPVQVNGSWTSRVEVQEHTGPDVVREIRADRPPVANWVGGSDAGSVDFTDSLLAGAPWAALIIAVATFVLLFLMTGSVIIPIKALLISTLSLGASVGVLVWGFEQGHLAGIMGFDAADITGVDALILTLILTFGFGLAMDYEMFLLSRIKEFHDAGQPTRAAIVNGLQSSGRIITSAALIIVLVFAGFATGELLQIKQIGIALAVTVLLDATLVRTLLVPAVMTVLEKILWWAPRWMKPLHERFGLHE